MVVCEEVPELATNQEEADTKVFLCANHAATKKQTSVCIKTVDSDIPIYALYFAERIPIKMYVEMTCCNRRMVLDINYIQQELGEKLCAALHSTPSLETTILVRSMVLERRKHTFPID